MKKRGINKGRVVAALRDKTCVERFVDGEENYSARDCAWELAELYGELSLMESSYRWQVETYKHYTKDDAYYLLTQGAHEQTERVQTSGPSDGVARAVASVDSFLVRLNREADEEFRKAVAEPHMRIVEQVELLDIARKSFNLEMKEIIYERFIYRTAKSKIKGADGQPLTPSKLKKAENAFVDKVEGILSEYKQHRHSGGERLKDEIGEKLSKEGY